MIWNLPFHLLFQQASTAEQALTNLIKCGNFELKCTKMHLNQMVSDKRCKVFIDFRCIIQQRTERPSYLLAGCLYLQSASGYLSVCSH